MSGGSFDYLCHKSDDELFAHGTVRSADEMADFLSGLGYAEDVARETVEFVLTVRAAQTRVDAMAERLNGVWRAAEWWQSCDSHEDQFRDALAKYRGEGATE